MADDRSRAEPKNLDRIDMEDGVAIRWWCAKLRCDEEELRFLVKRYGNGAREIEALLRRCSR